MNIEIGKYYKTRGGRKARIYAVDGGAGDMPHGAILNTGYWSSIAWFPNGAAYSHGECQQDLLAPWVDQPEFDRSLLPAWINHSIAMDEDGIWRAYDHTPIMGYGCWEIALGGGSSTFIPTTLAPKWSGDWKQSLLVFEDEEQNQKGEG